MMFCKQTAAEIANLTSDLSFRYITLSGHPPRKFSSRSRHQQQLLQLHLQGREIKPMASFLHCGNTEFLLQEIHIVEITEIHSNSFLTKIS